MPGKGSGELREWIREVGRVLGRAEVATGHFRLDVLAPGTAARVRPGQFAMVRVGPGPDTVGGGPFLARPLSFFDIDPSRGVISFLVRVVGEGTRALASCRPGDGLLLTGPFGNGFPPVSEGALLLVAGGVGVAPFPPVARTAASAGVPVRAVVGARTAGLLLGVRELQEAGAEVITCTEDGSQGVRGTVTDALPAVLRQPRAGPPTVGPAGRAGAVAPGEGTRVTVFACGPPAMLAAVDRLLARERAGWGTGQVTGQGSAEEEWPFYVSLEARMGCGFGVCRGCAVPARGGGYLHVCQEGPVFPAVAVDLEGVARIGV